MTFHVKLSHLSVAAAVAAMLAVPHPAKGAVRVCKERVSSVIVIDKSEKAGKRRALDDCKMKAGLFGERYTSWRLAANKRLACTVVKGQGYACFAYGSPCTIKQVPPLKRSGPSPFPADARSAPTPAKIGRCNGRTKV